MSGKIARIIHFEDKGQGFLAWDLDDRGVVIQSRPFQTAVWAGTRVIVAVPGSPVAYRIGRSPRTVLLRYKVERITEVEVKPRAIFYSIAALLRRYTRPVSDERYLRFIRRFPCVACGSTRHVESAHLGPRGLAQKTSDYTALPVCAHCHRTGPHALHTIGPELFEARHGLDFNALQRMFNEFYFLRSGCHADGWEQERERRDAA